MLGGYQSDYARNLHREGRDLADLTAEVVRETLDAARTPATGIGVVHVANAFAEMFAGQGHLGAMPATIEPALWSVPASRHEADRKSVVEGKSVPGRVDLGGRRIIKKKNDTCSNTMRKEDKITTNN